MDLYEKPEAPARAKGKVPDISFEVLINNIHLGAPFPTIAVEIGYSQSYPDLLEAMRFWLLLTLRNTRCTILVKMGNSETTDTSDVRFGDITKWTGFLEVWHRIE
jgi:hypothetical protein